MDEKPELVVFSMNRIGGVQSYYYNILSNDLANDFNKLWILTDCLVTKDARPAEPFNCCRELIFEYQPESPNIIADRLHKLVSNQPGVVMVNHELELVTLHKYRKRNKTLVFVCHDEMYLKNALKYEFLIDVYIAHNPHFYEELKKRLPSSRSKDIYYLPYGITPASNIRKANPAGKLKILFIARITEKKGVFDLKKIDNELLKAGVIVEWTIIGDGPERSRLIQDLKDRTYFTFLTPSTNEEILEIASKHDAYLLPSYLDGLPVALLEAMSAGLVPIVSRFNNGIDAVVESNNGFIVPMGDITGFAHKIKFLNDHRDELELRSVNARKKILMDYEIKSRARDYYALFRQFKKLKRPLTFRRAGYMGSWDYPWVPQYVRSLLRSVVK